MLSPLPRPRALLFDWDNTLIDSWVCIQHTYNATFRHFGLPEWDMAQTRAQVAASMRDSFPTMFGERWQEAAQVFSAAFAATHLDYLAPSPGAAALVEALAATDLVLAVVSNKRGYFLRAEAAALGWSGHFVRLVGAEDAPCDKPDPAAVELALAGTGLSPSPEVWFIGDATVDIDCAVRSGCTPVLLRSEPPRPGEFVAQPARTVADCHALAGLLADVAVPIPSEWC